jgi:hypothetical protein
MDPQMQDGGGLGTGMMIVQLALFVFFVAVNWKIFAKAGQPGWLSLIPIYNLVIFLKIIGRPVWWLVLFLVPLINFVVIIICAIDLAKSFGKGTGYGIGLVFLGFIFAPMLAFGSSTYKGPAAGGAVAPAPATA